MGLTIGQALSVQGVNAVIDATETGKDMLKDNFKSATVVRLLKKGFWADIESKDGTDTRISVKKRGKNFTVISKR